METRFLQTFLSVVETSSLAETARRLNITPSAVVQRIRAIEAELGLPLIRRSGHATRPTAAGEAIVGDARRLLLVERDLHAAAAADLEAGLLRVGFIQTALTGVLPDLLTVLGQRRPGIELYIAPGVSGDLYKRVLDGELDAAIIVEPPFAIPKSLAWRSLRREPMLLMAPEAIDVSDPRGALLREPFIRYDRNHWGGRLVDLYLKTERIQPTELCELDALEAILVLVGRGLGVALVPDWMPSWPDVERVRRVELRDAPAREIGILWLDGTRRIALLRAFTEELAGLYRRGSR